jgi:hypothetical protein
MAKLIAEKRDADALEAFLHQQGLKHLHVSRRADLLTIESAPTDDPIQHARFRRVTAQRWRLEMSTRPKRWETTPFMGVLVEVQQVLVDSFPWMLTSRE